MSKPDDPSSRSPLDRLAEIGFFGGPAKPIEEEERRGGEQMVEASVVPTQGSEALVELGFQLGEICADDPIFREVVAPEGWTRAMGENPYGYWTYLVDPDGVRRVAMFYKAAFYDRHAHCSLVKEPE